MKFFNKEEKVGLLVVLALISLVYLTFKAGDLTIRKNQGLVLYADFPDAGGLEKGAQVRVAGVQAGKVDSIVLLDGKPRLTLHFNPGVKIRRQATAGIQSLGFMGEKYLEINPGEDNQPYLESEQFIKVSNKSVDYDQLAQQASSLVEELQKVAEALSEVLASPEGKATLQGTLSNIKVSTDELRNLLEGNAHQVEAMVNNLQEFSSHLNSLITGNETKISQMIQDLQKFAEILREKAPVLATHLQSAAEDLAGMLTENRQSVREGIVNVNNLVIKLQGTADHFNGVLSTIQKGEGTIGKLVKDDEIYQDLQESLSGVKNIFRSSESFRIFLGFRGEYHTRFEESKSYVSLKLQPQQDKFYLLEVVDDFRGFTTNEGTRVFVDGNGPVTTRKELTEDNFKISLEIAKRFNKIALRGGLIESTGGVGLDYYLMDDDLTLHFDAFDFTANEPNLKFCVNYHFAKIFALNAGADNLVNNDRISFFLGAGFSFEDQDLKYLLGKIPVPGF